MAVQQAPLHREGGRAHSLKQDGWLEKHDCAVMSTKGFSTRAARDLIDKLAAHGEPIKVFCVHDADASGGMIYQTLQEATKARKARKIEIVNLGLEPWEALARRAANGDGQSQQVSDWRAARKSCHCGQARLAGLRCGLARVGGLLVHLRARQAQTGLHAGSANLLFPPSATVLCSARRG